MEAGATAAPNVCTPPGNFQGLPKTPPFKGCISPANILEFAIDKYVGGLTSGNEDAGTWVKTFVAPAVDVFINKSPGASAAKDVSFCMSSWNGTEIADSLEGAPEACSAMPLNPDSNYLLVSLTIPGTWLPASCPATIAVAEAADSKASICLAIGSCGGKPTGFFGMSGPALGCIIESASAAATGGIGSAAGAGVAGLLSFAGAGFSVGADLYLEVPFWNFGEPGDAKVYGHFAAVMAIDLGEQFSSALGLDEDSSKYFTFEGACTFIVRFPTLSGQKLTDATGMVKKDNKSWMKKLTEFQVAIVAHISLGLTFSQSSNPLIAVLPDLPPFKLAQISGLISTVDSSISGVDKGAYFLVTTGNLLGSILASLAGWVKLFVGDALDTILPDGWKMDDIVAKMKAIKLESIFAFSVTSKKIGFFLQPITGLSLSCQVQYKPFGFGCSVNLAAVSILFNMFKKGGEWVIAEAKQWFQETGKVISSMAADTFKSAKRWTKSVLARASTACPAGFRDDGFYCFKPKPYGRGTGCFKEATCLAEAKPLGTSSCEQVGLLLYPNCKPGFHSYGCCICTPDCPAGWTDIGISCLKPAATTTSAPLAVATAAKAPVAAPATPAKQAAKPAAKATK